jgi:hypothetical protein
MQTLEVMVPRSKYEYSMLHSWLNLVTATAGNDSILPINNNVLRFLCHVNINVTTETQLLNGNGSRGMILLLRKYNQKTLIVIILYAELQTFNQMIIVIMLHPGATRTELKRVGWLTFKLSS